MAGASKTKKQAGEGKDKPAAPVVQRPIDEAKVLKLIHGMAPEIREKSPTLQDGVTQLLAENDRLKRQVKDLEKNTAGPAIAGQGSLPEIMAGIKRLEDSFKQLKDQFSTMRQYGIGAGK